METEFANVTSRIRTFRIIVFSTLFFLSMSALGAILLFYFLQKPPTDFPTNSTTSISQGASVSEIVEQFEQQHYVRSGTLLQAMLAFMYDATAIQAGVYSFTEPLTLREVAEHITRNGPEEPLLPVTFPEGLTIADFAAIAESALPQFDATTFLTIAMEKEGALFPETYFVPEYYTEVDLFELMRDTHTEVLEQYQEEIDSHNLDQYEILTLASIIEREANTPESMKGVSSVLQNRLAIGMPLQADASIEYVLETPLRDLPEGVLAQVLKTKDSPYNTYLYKGLPPTPIGNPGRDSIEAVLFPIETEYLYYITDNEGVFHFATSLQEHNANIARYLR